MELQSAGYTIIKQIIESGISLFLFLSEVKVIKKQFMLNFNFLQFGEILGILPNAVAKATRNFESEIY